MENIEKKDLRVFKTKRAIKETFKMLILEKNYEDITVKELTDRAEINKKTFYRYYSSLDDLLLEMQTEISQEYLEEIKDLKLPDDYQKMNDQFYLFSEKKGEFYEKLTCDINYDYIRQKMINNVMSNTISNSEKMGNLTDYEQKILLTYMQAASLAIYKFWIHSGKQISLKEIIDLSYKLKFYGISGLFNKK